MPRNYKRSTLRASWSERDLLVAMEKVRSKEMGVNEAARTYKIPSRTLRRHLITGKLKVPLGRNPVFNQAHEKKLVAHIKKLEKVGFAPDRKDVKNMAYQLAKTLKVKNPFSPKLESAGNVWFNGFLTRNPELTLRKSEGLSLSRAYGVNRKDIKDFFDLLANIYKEYDFQNRPDQIFNMDETGIQINNKPGKVIATKGAKDVYTLTSSEKGENVTVVSCCNAQGNFLPPTLIYKGTYSKPQFSEGLPPGSQVFMNKKSSYINSELFMKWFEEVFLQQKGPGKALLILDGHSSHSNNILLLEMAKQHDVTLLCLPSHTTHALQPLDRAFFRPLKIYFAQEAKSWMIMNKDKKLTRYDVSKLIGKAWGKAATVANGISALKSCGIYPFDPNIIPDHYFSLSDAVQEQGLIDTPEKTQTTQTNETKTYSEPEPVAGPSRVQSQKTPPKDHPLPLCSSEVQETPTKILSEIHPVPKLPPILSKNKQTAIILTSPEHIEKRKLVTQRKAETLNTKLEKSIQKIAKKQKENSEPKTKKRKKVKRPSSSKTDEESEKQNETSEEEISDDNENNCIECTENYFSTTSKEDWIQCSSCFHWMHEFCTMYNPQCNRCGRKAKRETVAKKQNFIPTSKFM